MAQAARFDGKPDFTSSIQLRMTVTSLGAAVSTDCTMRNRRPSGVTS
jgi:hypothetical protein